MARNRKQLAMAIVGVVLLLANTTMAGTTKLPHIRLTAAAASEATAMLSAEDDQRAVLTLAKGDFEILDEAGGVKERRSGWMVRIVNREQFVNEKRTFVDGLEILIPQEHLYHELEGAILGYSHGWLILRTEE